MSPTNLSDTQLDALLGQVSSPPLPPADLAERIADRAQATAQQPIRRFAPAPVRHRPRRLGVWSAFIAANALAAAAAASSWDGQRFDLSRLADLPHRVVAAIHLSHHRGHEQRIIHPPGRSAVVLPAAHLVLKPHADQPVVRQMSVPVSARLEPRAPHPLIRVHPPAHASIVVSTANRRQVGREPDHRAHRAVRFAKQENRPTLGRSQALPRQAVREATEQQLAPERQAPFDETKQGKEFETNRNFDRRQERIWNGPSLQERQANRGGFEGFSRANHRRFFYRPRRPRGRRFDHRF